MSSPKKYRKLDQFGGSRGEFRANPGKKCWKMFAKSRNALSSRIWAPGKANLPQTLGRHFPGPFPHLLCGVLFEIDNYNLLESSLKISLLSLPS